MRRLAHDGIGSRADERQQLVSLRSRALACNLAVIAAFIGLTAAIAVKAAWWWPFLAILVIAGLGYLFGLSNYGAAEQDTQDDAGCRGPDAISGQLLTFPNHGGGGPRPLAGVLRRMRAGDRNAQGRVQAGEVTGAITRIRCGPGVRPAWDPRS